MCKLSMDDKMIFDGYSELVINGYSNNLSMDVQNKITKYKYYKS